MLIELLFVPLSCKISLPLKIFGSYSPLFSQFRLVVWVMTSFQSRWDNPCRRCGDMMCALSILCIRTAYRWIPGYAKRIGGMGLSCFTRVPLACARPPGAARLSLVQGQYPKTINWFRYFPGRQKKHYGYVVISLIMIETIAFSAHRA